MSDRRAISRRTLVKSGLGAIAAPAVLRVLPAEAQSQVIKIGHVSPKPKAWKTAARRTRSKSFPRTASRAATARLKSHPN